jgi:hypothetical protein
MRVEADHAVSREVMQRLAHRGHAHPEHAGDLRLADPGVRLQLPAENRLFEKLIYAALHRLPAVLVQRVKSGGHVRSVARQLATSAVRERPVSSDSTIEC